VFDALSIRSPKRASGAPSGWGGFFPYYAGFPEIFARVLLQSAKLSTDAIVLDPWNGSGTTTYTASLLGLTSQGFDLNPVMIIVARARLLPPSEADSIEPLAREIVRFSQLDRESLDNREPLSLWFSNETAALLRGIERGIRRRLVGGMTITPEGIKLDRLSGLAATFYVALFTVCRELAAPFLSSNPTWLRRPKHHEPKIDIPRQVVESKLILNLCNMALALANRRHLLMTEQGVSEVSLTDTTATVLPEDSVDVILTSPPYCTRIDYTAATRVELAVLAPLGQTTPEDLSRQMLGSTRVPTHAIEICPMWGQRCHDFLDALRKHPSKASSGYYYKTHLDYFDKMARSLGNLTRALKPDGAAVLVVQDSFYKEIHNDLPSIVTEMAEAYGLRKRRREDFRMSRSMSGINPYTRVYKRLPGSVEAVLCFSKH
jgi:tRNA G10  N-methylase Trm11